jgi:hypothetical protein
MAHYYTPVEPASDPPLGAFAPLHAHSAFTGISVPVAPPVLGMMIVTTPF